MSSDDDLFAEEQSMVTMSFGEHIEELRLRLILALIGLFVGVIVVFIPPFDIGWRIMKKMEEPAKVALAKFYREQYEKKAQEAEAEKTLSPKVEAVIDAKALFAELRRLRQARAAERGSARGQDARPAHAILRRRDDQGDSGFDGADRPEPGLAGTP